MFPILVSPLDMSAIFWTWQRHTALLGIFCIRMAAVSVQQPAGMGDYTALIREGLKKPGKMATPVFYVTHVICQVSHVRCKVSYVKCQVSHVTCNSQTVRARKLNFWNKVHLLPPVTSHVSQVTCHMSYVHFFKWIGKLVEGLLSTGPTPSSLIDGVMVWWNDEIIL